MYLALPTLRCFFVLGYLSPLLTPNKCAGARSLSVGVLVLQSLRSMLHACTAYLIVRDSCRGVVIKLFDLNARPVPNCIPMWPLWEIDKASLKGIGSQYKPLIVTILG